MNSVYHPSWKIAVAVAAPFLLAIGIIGWLIAPSIPDGYVNTVLIVACSSIGWSAGMMLSPDSRLEEKKFTGLWKGVSLFASGYLVSKIDPLVDAMLKADTIKHVAEPLIAYRVLAAVATIVLTAIVTYVVRVYAFTVDG
jgi:hypothetical protein